MKKKWALQAIAAIAGGLLFFLSVMPLSVAQSRAGGQKSMIEFGFSARNIYEYVQPDSIKVMNRTQGCQVTMHWPDTVLMVLNVGIPEEPSLGQGFRVYNNYPNPVADQTTVTIFVPEKDVVTLAVTDLMGRAVFTSEQMLDKGVHSFRFTPGRLNLCFFTAQWRGIRSSIRVIHTGFGAGSQVSVVYAGTVTSAPEMKAVKDVQDFIFCFGDELLFIGYANGMQSGIIDTPEESKDYTFQFATNIPCPGTPTVDYDGQVYQTIQIFSQCWLKENLNVGTMIPGSQDQVNNGIIEKYCYDDDPNNCITYGGLYQWDEMMQYTTQQGTQGICPPGWHLPTDEEWKILEGAVDSEYGIGNVIWEGLGYCGYDAGTNLKTTSGWFTNGNGTDLFGFSGLPGGYGGGGVFQNVGLYGAWWPSTEYEDSDAWHRSLHFTNPEVWRYHYGKEGSKSVRCIRNEPFVPVVPTVTTAEVTEITQNSAICGGNVINDGGAFVSARGVVWSTNPNPTIENNEGITSNGTGTGEFTSDLTSLTPGTEYFVRAYATNSEGTAYGEEFSFTTNTAGFVCGTSTVTDIDGNIYNTVLIGSQCWMKENLKTTTYKNGTPIPNVTDATEWQNLTTGAYVWYDNDINWKNSYGALYNWYATVDPNGLCPAGWHVPSHDEWTQLENYVVAQGFPNNDPFDPNGAGNALKSCRQVNSPMGGECNTTGLLALALMNLAFRRFRVADAVEIRAVSLILGSAVIGGVLLNPPLRSPGGWV